MFKKALFPALLLLIFVFSCNPDKNPEEQGTLNFFSINDDIALGQQTRDAILADPTTYPILDSSQYSSSYAYMFKVRDNILNAGQVHYKDKFAWELYIIHDDSTLNAFCTPGGYIFFYTGLLKYLVAEDQLAGVMGHEMGHADLRHSTYALTEQYGLAIAYQILTGKEPGLLAQFVNTLTTLSRSRKRETAADEASVRYLCPTAYEANGAADFFSMVQNDGIGAQIPTIFSSHPADSTRINHINDVLAGMTCGGTNTFDQEYANFKATLP